MIVSHEHQFIFIKTRKTAGTSIEIAMSEHLNDDDVITAISREDGALRERGAQNNGDLINHTPYSAVCKNWPGYYTMCVERNPFDRFISDYWWVTRDMDVRPDINDWHQTSRKRSNWDIYGMNGFIHLDCVVRYCNLQEDLDDFCEMVDMPKLVLPHAKGRFRQNHEHYSKVLNAETRAHIEAACWREMEVLEWCQWREHDEED